ncbi:MAG: ribosome-associated translation inhibitor RaiA [Ruminococcus sp.]|nr:ribosome-associated translation inhibitor RaiA [Ruminococcus sp.]
MKMTITARKMQIPQKFTDYAESRLNTRLNKFFGDEADAKIIMSAHKNLIIIELTVTYNNIIYRAEQSAVDKEDALDASIDKIIRQIRKNKTRIEKKLKASAFQDYLDEQPLAKADHEIIRHKKFVMHPMDLDEAILQMDLLGHAFFMFTNANTGEVNVVYKRADGKYAVLEPIYE